MKLNPECIRDVMLDLEENLDVRGGLMLVPALEKGELKRIKKHNFEDIIYTCKKLNEANFISFSTNICAAPNPYVFSKVGTITWSGHQFLDDIRDEKVWRDVKQTASKVSSVSIPILQQISAAVIARFLGLA
ncbi:DUF2513 domain-containing protein [Lactococcus petauri]|uniref:DUF2513 domain-containing protein n=1 Tax=Lactococcus petauri TaxID=1940789 RepID=UPI0032554D41